MLPVGPNFISPRVHMHSCITCLNLKTIDQRHWNPSITSLKFPIKWSSILRAVKSIKKNSLKIWLQKCVYILLKANKSKSQTHHIPDTFITSAITTTQHPLLWWCSKAYGRSPCLLAKRIWLGFEDENKLRTKEALWNLLLTHMLQMGKLHTYHDVTQLPTKTSRRHTNKTEHK